MDMSKETFEAFYAALAAHVTDELDGAYLTDWHMVACAFATDDTSSYIYVTNPRTSPHALSGLLERSLRRAHHDDSWPIKPAS